MNNLPNIQEIYVKGQNSLKVVKIEVEVVAVLVNAYMTLIPNEKRDVRMSLRVLRLHDDLADLLKREASAVANERVQRTSKVYEAELGIDNKGEEDEVSI